MTVETYGEHAENAARALNWLLGEDSIPVDPTAVDRLLKCRQGVVDALRQRLHHFGLTIRYPAGTLPAPAPGLNLEGIDNKLATLLNTLACSAPNIPLDQQYSPLEVLGTPVTDPVAETWREAAVELLAASHALAQASGSAWTDDGRQDEERALKHRAGSETRPVPAHPELVAHLRRHLKHFATGGRGRLFVARTGRAGPALAPPYVNPVAMGSVYRAWHRARAAALTEKQFASMVARRPYDLRHACLSTWLNAGVPAAQAAEWAGHTVEVLHRVYAKCVDGDDAPARQRIEAALRPEG